MSDSPIHVPPPPQKKERKKEERKKEKRKRGRGKGEEEEKVGNVMCLQRARLVPLCGEVKNSFAGDPHG